MMTLVIGGAASGKSEFAEALAAKTSFDAPRIYVATMEPFDKECLERIKRHRAMRAGKSFETLECYTGLEEVDVPAGSTVLLECVSNLCANELYSPDGRKEQTAEVILKGVEHLRHRCGDLIVVSNEVFSGGTRYEGDTLHYLWVLAEINRGLAAMADNVCEVVSGVPVYHKGERYDRV